MSETTLPTFHLSSSHILVTGGAKRVGEAVTRRLAQSGARLLVHTNTSIEEAQSLVLKLRSEGQQADWIQADLTNPGDLARLAEAVGPSGEFPINALVHGASRYMKKPLLETTLDFLDEDFAVHVRAPLALARAMAARLIPQQLPGRIVHITDASLNRPYAGFSSYFTTKSALDGLTRSLALELAPWILVNNVAPGTVLPPPLASDNYIAALARQSPLQQIGRPEDVAHAVEYLLTERGFITGSTLTVDGGATTG